MDVLRMLEPSDPRRGPGEELLLAARFATPTVASVHVPRPRLTAALDRAEDLPLVLVSAPAGTGKTTAVADWARNARGTVCWVAFDDGEESFWDAILESLRRNGLDVPTSWTVPDAGLLGHRRLSALVGLIVGATERLTVVVDGYELASRELAREVDFLLGHVLGRLCLVFVGRVDPILPLYRYRLTDTVLELRAADLAFRDEESARLMRSSGVEIDASAIHDLNERLSGWVVGLVFAARALAGRDDAAQRVAVVVEQAVDINEYLIGEVLDAQPPDIRRFLLDTCVTPTFCGDLAEAVGGVGARRAMMGLGERQAFVEPVPGLPGSFRYHPFFRNLLLAVLTYESPERVVENRRSAAAWYRRHGRHAESLAQLAMVGDWTEMAHQVVDDGLVGRLLLEDPMGELGGLAVRLPPHVDDPAARVVLAAEALRHGAAGRERCARELASVRRVLGDDGGPDRRLAVAVTVTDALRACLGDPCDSAGGLAAEAERLVMDELVASARGSTGELEVAVAYAGGVVALRRGDLSGARDGLARAATLATVGVSPAFRADCLGRLAVADALWGELAGAVRHAEEALSIASRAGLGHLDVPPSVHVALAWTGVERCNATITTKHIAAARSSRVLPEDPFCQSLVEAAVAALERATGQADVAADRLQAAIHASASRDPWVADLLRVEAARLSLGEGAPEQALEVLAGAQLPDRLEVSVAAAAARSEQGGADHLDARLVRDGTASLDTRVRALLVEASQAARDSSPGQARSATARALRLASPEHLRRPFHDSDATVRRQLSADPRLAREHDWLSVGALAGARLPIRDPSGLPILVDPLTAKELEVLGHLAELLTTDEIARVMFVSVNTVRTHIRHVLGKLGVNRRNAAIRRARELGVLEDQGG